MTDVEAVVGFPNLAVVDVDAILILEGGIRALPGSDTAAAAAEFHIRFSDPERTESVEKVRLATNNAFVHVGIP